MAVLVINGDLVIKIKAFVSLNFSQLKLMNDGYTHADINKYIKRKGTAVEKLAEDYVDPEYWP